MQKQLHLVCSFPMETRLNPTNYEMNTELSASSVSEHKMTRETSSSRKYLPITVSSKNVSNNCTDGFFKMHHVTAVQWGRKEERGVSRYH